MASGGAGRLSHVGLSEGLGLCVHVGAVHSVAEAGWVLGQYEPELAGDLEAFPNPGPLDSLLSLDRALGVLGWVTSPSLCPLGLVLVPGDVLGLLGNFLVGVLGLEPPPVLSPVSCLLVKFPGSVPLPGLGLLGPPSPLGGAGLGSPPGSSPLDERNAERLLRLLPLLVSLLLPGRAVGGRPSWHWGGSFLRAEALSVPPAGAEVLLDGGPSEAGDYSGSGSGERSETWARWKTLGAAGENLLGLLLLLAYLLLPGRVVGGRPS